jgi:hypothetical protein
MPSRFNRPDNLKFPGFYAQSNNPPPHTPAGAYNQKPKIHNITPKLKENNPNNIPPGTEQNNPNP